VGRETDHHHHLTASLKNAWSYTSTLLLAFVLQCFIKHRVNFAFPFLLLVVVVVVVAAAAAVV
jgi:hypothetical protein